jgi:hypothetical protein
MNKPIYLSAGLQLAADDKGDDHDKAINGIAYSGDAVTQWGERLVIDLATLAVVAPSPLLLQHRDAQIVGITQSIDNNRKRLALTGSLFSSIDDQAKDVAAKAKRGIPYQMSVGVYDGNSELVPAGNDITVNARQFTGPLTVIRNGTLRETSIVALGADPNTRADIAAHRHPEKPPMPDPTTQPAQPVLQATELTARITALEAELSAANQRADDLQAKADKQANDARLAAVKALFKDTGQTFSDDNAAPYLGMTQAQFDASAAMARKLAANKPDNHRLFPDADPNRHADTAPAASLSITDIYAKRKVA